MSAGETRKKIKSFTNGRISSTSNAPQKEKHPMDPSFMVDTFSNEIPELN